MSAAPPIIIIIGGHARYFDSVEAATNYLSLQDLNDPEPEQAA